MWPSTLLKRARSRFVNRTPETSQLLSDSSKDAAFDSPENWGSPEEHEIQSILQEVIATLLVRNDCNDALLRLKSSLETAPDEWVDRFSMCQGSIVLKKLLVDINSTEKYLQLCDLEDYDPAILEQELVIIECFDILYARSSVARQLTTSETRQSLVQALLKSALSPNQDTRRAASAALDHLKSASTSSSLLQLIALYREPSYSTRETLASTSSTLPLDVEGARDFIGLTQAFEPTAKSLSSASYDFEVEDI